MNLPGPETEHGAGKKVAAGGISFWTPANVAGLALIGVVFTALAAWTWRKWPDAVIDFGTQLYIPWRLNDGSVLYRDLYYFAGGPFSQYFNAFLFNVFGTSFSTLIAANMAITLAMLFFIFKRFQAAANTLTATVIGLGIVTIFVFSELTHCGNYNFIAPYSHEVVHGLVLSLLAIGCLTDWLGRQRLAPACLAGLCAGLVFLTKPDIFLALGICCGVTLLLHWYQRRECRFACKSAAAFGLAASLPALAFFFIFLKTEDWRTSLHSVVFGWTPLFVPAVRHSPFYQRTTGMDQPLYYLKLMAAHFGCAVLAIAAYALLFRGIRRWKLSSELYYWIFWLVVVTPLAYWASQFQWILCGRSLPLWCLVSAAVLGCKNLSSGSDAKWRFPFLWAVFALILMSKLGVFARIFNYGFALAMPAFVTTIYFLVWLLPRLLETKYRVPARFMRATVLVVLLIGMIIVPLDSQTWYRSKELPVGTGGDTFKTFGPGIDFGEGIKVTLDWINQNIAPNETFAMLPSGITLNYLSRRVNPTPDLFWDPNSMAVFGQANMTARFEANPPDYVITIEQDHSEFNVGYFGSYPGYGVDLMDWIKQNYKAVVIIGNEPLKDGRFGLEIYRRLPTTPAVPTAEKTSL